MMISAKNAGASRGFWSLLVTVGLVAGVVGLALLGPTQWAVSGPSPEEIEAENARPHSCEEPDCDRCESMDAWLADHPGSSVWDSYDAAESDRPTIIFEPVTD